MTELTTWEQDRLSVLEEVIDYGLQTFVDVGEALMEIRDSRLYRDDYSTFEGYCQDRWGLNRSHSYRLMDAAKVVGNLQMSPMGDIPRNERQARPLTKLEPEQQREAWQTAVETAPGGKVTASHVEEVVKDITNGAKPKMAVHYSSDSPEWETPQELFDTLDAEFGFTLDVCATAENAKCDIFYSSETDGLAQVWRGVCWMNPPYGREIGQWVEKAVRTALEGATVVCLVPARVDTSWWWDYCIYGEIRFIRGRLKFGGGNSSAPFPSAVVVFRPNVEPDVMWWDWRPA